MMELWYALVDLLPFEWAQPGSMYFMKNALLAVLVISPLFGILSTMVVHSRMSFFSDALGHSAFTGMAIGALCGFSEPIWAAVLFSLVFALLFNFVRRRTRLASDTVIGVFSSTAVALGIFISTLGSRSFTKFNSLLIGDILSVEPGKIGLLALILLLVLALWGLSFNHLMLSAVHPALADSRGVRVFWQEALFSAAIAVVVTVSMTWVGLLVINSLLVLPAALALGLLAPMLGVLGIHTELDLRGENGIAGYNALGYNVNHIRVNCQPYYNDKSTVAQREAVQEAIRQVFAVLADESNYPIYIHDVYGCDETGMICYLLEAVLGVNDTELKKDFDMSAFSLCAPTSSVYQGFVQMVRIYGNGNSTQERVVDFLTGTCGVPAGDLLRIRSILLEDAAA